MLRAICEYCNISCLGTLITVFSCLLDLLDSNVSEKKDHLISNNFRGSDNQCHIFKNQ